MRWDRAVEMAEEVLGVRLGGRGVEVADMRVSRMWRSGLLGRGKRVSDGPRSEMRATLTGLVKSSTRP